jgi:hypothetical protein
LGGNKAVAEVKQDTLVALGGGDDEGLEVSDEEDEVVEDLLE